MSDWMPIETAPRNTEVLVAYRLRGREIVVQSAQLTEAMGDDIWSWSVSDNKFGPYPLRGTTEPLLGWMPLPDPPDTTEVP